MSGESIFMRVNVIGYSGQAVSAFCAYDPISHVLSFGRVDKYEGGVPKSKAGESRRDRFLLLTNQVTDAAHDQLISSDDMRDAIDAFFAMNDSESMVFGEGLAGHNPSHRIERDGVDERGVKYRLAADVSNGMVAAIFAALAAVRQRNQLIAEDTMADFLMIDV